MILGRKTHSAFAGSDAINWIQDNLDVKSRDDARKIGTRLLQHAKIELFNTPKNSEIDAPDNFFIFRD